ncbi:hypothetical protein CRENBAI_011343, partial [Crenichthys baileyi]
MIQLQQPQLKIRPRVSQEEEWSLEPYGMCGVWGYIFKYEIGELCLYQLDQYEEFDPSATRCTLTHNDWAVLRLAIPHLNDSPETVSMQEREGEEENELSPRPAKRARMFNILSDVDIAEREHLFSAVLGSKTTGTGRWSIRASRHKNNHMNPSDLFVLEAFNQDCGIFKTMLALLFEAWAEKMSEIEQRLSNHFHNSHCWIDVIKLTDTENRILRMSEAYDKTPYRDLYNHQADIHCSPEHDEIFNFGTYHPPSPDLFSPSTSTSSFSETHFSPASPTGYNMKLYQPPSPDLYSPSLLFMAESVNADIQPEDKMVVVEDETGKNCSTRRCNNRVSAGNSLDHSLLLSTSERK